MPPKFSFYELTTSPLEKILPRFLEQLYAQQIWAVLRMATLERVDMLSHLLWAYRPNSFLPHASIQDGDMENQPFWLTTGDEKPSKAQALILIDSMKESDFEAYTRFFYFFDSHQEEEKGKAKTYWEQLQKTSLLTLNFWKQDTKGQWEACQTFTT